MRWRTAASIGWPPAAVRAVARDHLGRLAAYLPEVTAVEAVSRHVEGDAVTATHRWHLDRSVFPALVASWIPDDALGFTADTRWVGDRATFTVTPRIHPDLVDLHGRLVLHDDGGDTLVDVEGVFTLSPEAARHLPSGVRDRGLPALEAGLAAAVRLRVARALAAIESVLDDAV